MLSRRGRSTTSGHPAALGGQATTRRKRLGGAGAPEETGSPACGSPACGSPDAGRPGPAGVARGAADRGLGIGIGQRVAGSGPRARIRPGAPGTGHAGQARAVPGAAALLRWQIGPRWPLERNEVRQMTPRRASDAQKVVCAGAAPGRPSRSPAEEKGAGQGGSRCKSRTSAADRAKMASRTQRGGQMAPRRPNHSAPNSSRSTGGRKCPPLPA